MKLRGRMDNTVDRATARSRALSAAFCADGRMHMSAFAYVIWPGRKFKSPQGAAYAAAPVIRKLTAERLLSIDGSGYRITSAGKQAVLNGEIDG